MIGILYALQLISYFHYFFPFQVATSLVLCTFLSAPIMYVIARMALITYASIDEYHSVIAESQRDVTIVACICLVRGGQSNSLGFTQR